jgi:uncharacterized protein (TIRG00374 family)
MSSRVRRGLQLAAGLLLSGLFLWLALKGEDWGAIRESIAQADYSYIALMVPLGVYGMYARCQRWQILLEKTHGRPVAMMPIYSASSIGFMANMLLPFRVGEVARPLILARDARLPAASTFATVIVERVLDLVALATYGIGIVLIADVPPEITRAAELAAGIAAIGFVAVYVVVIRRTTLLPLLDRIWNRIPKLGPAILRVEHEIVDGMSAIADPLTMVRCVLWSLYIWLIVAVSFALGFKATGMDVPFLFGGITVATIVALAVSVPSAPAFVGQYEWGCKVALEQIFGVAGGAAIGYSILLHTTQFLIQIALGVVFLAREGLSLSDLAHMKSEVEGEV